MQETGDWKSLQDLMADYKPDGPPADRERLSEAVTAWLRDHPDGTASGAGAEPIPASPQPPSRCRAMMLRWTWLVPSKIWVILASR